MRRRVIAGLLAQLSMALLLATWALAEGGVDKSGIKPQVLKLPSGPGSIEGLGESFEPQLNTGTSTYSVPLKVSPGRAGLAPRVALVYNGGTGNGPLGIGWRFSFGSIQRRTDKGLPVYDDSKDIFVSEEGEELVDIGGGFYRRETEGAFDRFERSGESWLVSHKDGSRSYYGVDAGARIQDGSNIFRWCISRQLDANGNEVLYRYNEDEAFAEGVAPRDGQAYLTSIVYNQSAISNAFNSVEFKYVTRPVDDRVFDYRSRFPVQTTQRCVAIVMSAGGQRVRSYKLFYNARSGLSRLARVEQYGRNEAAGPLESILSFEYTEFDLNSEITAMDLGFKPGAGLHSADVDLVDMNNDALPDLLDTTDYHSVCLNADGRAWEEPYKVPGGFSSMKLNQNNTMLMDMNGDGFSDLFVQDEIIHGYRYFPGGQPEHGWALEPINMTNSPSFTFGITTKPLDLDHDGRTDVIQKADGADQIACIFNLRGAGYSQVYAIDAPSRLSAFNFDPEPSSRLRLADMNGDGLQDFVVLNAEGYIWYYPGHGVTQDGATPWDYQGWDNTPRGAWPASDSTAQGYLMADAPDHYDVNDFSDYAKFRKVRLLDLNGDGLDDLLYFSNNQIFVWLNRGGHGFSPEPYAIAHEPGQVAKIPYKDDDTYVRMADMNGNGTVDMVWNRRTGFLEVGYPETSWVYLDFTRGTRPNLLKRIKNGIGQVTTLEYRSSTEYLVADRNNGRAWPHKVPFPVNVVSRIEVFDGRESTYARELTYHDGYYDGAEKEFRGFAQAEQQEIGDATAPDLIMAYRFHTGAPKEDGTKQEFFKGKPLAVEARTRQEDVFYRETYTWDRQTIALGVNGDERQVTFPYQQQKVRDILEMGNGTPVQLKWEYEYGDHYGNLTRLVEHGRMDAGWDDEKITSTSYTAGFSAGQTLWLLDRVVEQTITDENGKTAAKKRHYYDDKTALGEVTKGNLTRVEEWTADQQYVVSVRNSYDAYGNIVAIRDPLHAVAPGHYRELVYDESYHAYPVEEIIHTGKSDPPTLRMTATYDYGWGEMTSSTDFNGFTSTYQYDNFGRLVAMTRPPDASPTLEYDYVLAHEIEGGKLINWVETRQADGSDDGFLHSRTFYDGMGRTVMTRAEGEQSGQVVVTDTVRFNARKQPWKKYLPYFETGSLDFVDPSYNSGFTEHFYDALGREVRINQPAGSEGTLFSTITYEPLARIVRDEEQNRAGSAHYGCGMRYVEDGLQDKDGKGRLREVYEIVKLSDAGEPLSSPVEWKTSYVYDLLRKFTGYTDSQQNRKMIEYDGLGRMTFMNDPDRGHMHYTYDDAGNLVKTVDAKGQVIEYGYDGVNRLAAEYYGEGKTVADVEYHYDTPFGPVDRGNYWPAGETRTIADAVLADAAYSADYDLNGDGKVDAADVVKARREWDLSGANLVTAQNTKGYLSWVRDQSGEEHNSYDQRGRVAWVVKRIKGESEGELLNFFTGNEYDSMDRVTRLTYPDSSYADYSYNSRGLLEAIPNVITRHDYNPAGQNALLQLACGTVTTYDFDHRLRLKRLATTRSRDQLKLQDLNYTYDGASNITRISDGRSSADLDAIGVELGIDSTTARKFDATQSFTYDSLYRLTQATNPSVYGTINYRYDRIGNMVLKQAQLLDPDPKMDLGVMTSGGSAGTWNRIGRNPDDPPGPHALTGTEKGAPGPLTFAFDGNGNVANDGQKSFSWDSKDRLTGFDLGSIDSEHLYDYENALRKKTKTDHALPIQDSATFYLNNMAEVRKTNLIKYVYNGQNRISEAGPAPSNFAPSYFHLHDHLGSTNFILSMAANLLNGLIYFPYGEYRKQAYAANASDLAKYTFGGKEKDVVSGLYYFHARYYAGAFGRFLSTDPISPNRKEMVQDLNTYGYALNRPIVMTDPTGKTEETFQNSLDNTLGRKSDAGTPDFYSQRNQSPYFSGDGNCLPNADLMTSNMSPHQPSSKTGEVRAVAPATPIEAGTVIPNRQSVKAAIAYIRSELSEDRRVVIGVNRLGTTTRKNEPHGDSVTDHFVTAYRLEESLSGNVTLYFRDSGTSHENISIGTLTLTGGLLQGSSPYVSGTVYQMTTVRRNNWP